MHGQLKVHAGNVIQQLQLITMKMLNTTIQLNNDKLM